MPPKPCLVCGVPVSTGSRCKRHGGEPFAKAREQYHPMPAITHAAVLKRDHYRCTQCGSTLNPEVDHLIPYAAGGTHTMGNARVLCRICHRKKTAHDGHEAWRKQK